jgi:flagellar protein FlbD
MIQLRRLNDTEIFVNPHQIEFMEEMPDTIIKMFSGKNILVKESAAEVIEKIAAYRKRIGFLGNDTIF